MCGIAGQLNFDGKLADQSLVKTMTRMLRHRGPDGEGFYFDKHVGLGHRRLSIIDLKTGRQPMSNEDGTIWLISNSEIYNFVELTEELESKGHRFRTQSDTEVIIHLYEELGEKCVEKLIGMFAFAVWDQKKNRLFLARDRFGIKPLHYFFDRNTFIFASEIKALLQYSSIDKTLNFSAIDQYFTFLYVLEPNTIFETIQKLPPAHYLVCEGNKITIRKYWDLEFSNGKQHPEKFYKERLKFHLKENIKLALRSDVPVGVFLSGGVDSSVVTASASRLNKSLKTFSVTFNEEIYSEQKYSRLVANAFETDHYELVVSKADALRIIPKLASFFDEPFGDSSSIPTYYVSQFASKCVKTVLTGEGGDELFAGYSWHQHRIPGKEDVKSLLMPPHKMIFTDRQREQLFSSDLMGEIKGNYLKDLDIDLRHLNKMTPLDKYLYLDFKTYLPSDMLTKVDRMSMMNSLERRLPLLNHPFAEFVNSIPASLKLKNGIRKYVFKKAFDSVLPKAIIQRSKMGFSIPLDIWLWENGRFKDFICDVIFDSKTKRRGYFNYKVIHTMFAEHDCFHKVHDQRIWTLFMFELWHRNFLN